MPKEPDSVRNCLTTITTCTWVSIHPNVPQHKGCFSEESSSCCGRSLSQNSSLDGPPGSGSQLGKSKKEYKGRGWTKLHGHFLIMGGVSSSEVIEMPQADVLRISEFPKEGTQRYRTTMERLLKDIEAYTFLVLEKHKHRVEIRSCDRVLSIGDLEHYRNYELGPWHRSNISYFESHPVPSFYRFKDLVDDSRITFPSLTAAEIYDKSKGDFLSKTIAILQTMWFIVQCLARH